MIKLEHVVLASPEQMDFIIEGMRNSMDCWGESSDSEVTLEQLVWRDEKIPDKFKLGPDDHSLMQRLSYAGTDYRKFMRMMPVYARITAPLYWWKEFDTYKVGTVSNSCNAMTMHNIQEKEFTLDDFSCEHLKNAFDVSIPYASNITSIFEYKKILEDNIEILNNARDLYLETKDKRFWWQMIQLLPSSYNRTRNEFCKWIEELPYSELILSA